MDLSRESFDRLVAEICKSLAGVEATIKPREVPFLALLGAYPTVAGCVLEIGAFKGASTIVLSRAARAAGDDHIWTVDPFTNACETELPGQTSYPEFLTNLKQTGEEKFVRVFKGLSQDLAKQWQEPIRVLWIDGDHSYKGVKGDLELFRPFLADGAIIAFHDVLTNSPGPCRVFTHEILASREFGSCGISGTIGWAQYVLNRKVVAQHHALKQRLYSKLSPYACANALSLRLSRLQRTRYLLLRNRHRQAPPPEKFLKLITRQGSGRNPGEREFDRPPNVG